MRLTRLVARATATAVTMGAISLAGMAVGTSAQAWDVSVWDRVAACESSGRWSINTGNGYYGGLQFSASTWKHFGGEAFAPLAHQATKAEQIAIARRTLHAQGPRAWPTCSVRAGLTKDNGGADPRAMPAGESSAPAPIPAPSKPDPAPAPSYGPLAVDGVLGRNTTRAMQSWVGTTPDGIWGPNTTRALQRTVGASVDGVRGPETTRKTQTVVGATADGVWGSGTTRALQKHLNERS